MENFTQPQCNIAVVISMINWDWMGFILEKKEEKREAVVYF